ncbi:cobalt ABC transporter permease [Pilimelia anulata]|uniref:Cobalt ABC transporter permease n=1 Tax=Pilimelia anulata TaxID=53371 RepID=A0A8J3FAH2_9ACTN|nr:energy-coupling factor transporter transmembrane component T [Pilimelia anulata]GGJ74424.1 cobalt ABC transporter permease [Pilimelia anulata]
MIGAVVPPVRLGRRNPVAKVGAALLFSLPLLATLDPLTPAVALAVQAAAVPLFGLRYRDVARRAWPLLLSALGVVVTLVPFAAERTGAHLVQLGPWALTTGVLATAAGLGLRIIAVALPGILVLATTDPTDLADALIQNVRLPARFALGALAALRLVPLLGAEWRTLLRARRARGLGDRTVGERAGAFAGAGFALLVGAIRYGVRLAAAMDARGLSSGVRRSVARPQRFGAADAALLAAAGVLAAAILALTAATGHLRPTL